jgi:myosin heavy subunit
VCVCLLFSSFNTHTHTHILTHSLTQTYSTHLNTQIRYACLFDFVLEKINESLSFDSPYPLIRVVESPGFAVTGVNRWSDFVSSYFAENIYRYYVHSMFVAEQEFLAKNLYGSDYVLPVKFRSNDETMDFMNHVISFFKSNASKTSSASALGCAKFLDYCKAKNSTAFGSFEDCLESKNEELKSMDLVAHEPSEFVIRHMSVLENASADTIYDATNILSEIDTCLSSTAKSLFAESAIGKVFENNTGTTEDLVKSAQNFTHILETSTPHFVHCLLSSIGDDEDFHGGCVLRQIRSIQLAQLAKSIKKGMPYKRSHKEFLSRYYSLAARNVFANVDLPALDPEDENTMLYSKRLQVALSKSPLMRNFKQSKLVKKGVTGGLGFVFFNKQSTHKTLERFRNKEINASVDILVRSLKTMLFRSKIKNYITMITSLKRAIKDRSLSDLNSLVIKARPMVERLVPLTWTLQAHFKNTLIRAESCIEHLNKQNDVEKRLDEILTMDPYVFTFIFLSLSLSLSLFFFVFTFKTNNFTQ